MSAKQVKTAQRMARCEELLAIGMQPGEVERQLAKEFEISERQARRIKAEVYKQWQEESRRDAPHRREKVIRMAERLYASCLTATKPDANGMHQPAPAYAVAVNVLNLMARMAGAMAQHDPERAEAVEKLGPVPDDPNEQMLYVRRGMLLTFDEVLRNGALDPERRLRWLTEIGSKIGMTHAQSLQAGKLRELEVRVLGAHEVEKDGLEPVPDGVDFPATSGFGRRHHTGAPPGGHLPDPPAR